MGAVAEPWALTDLLTTHQDDWLLGLAEGRESRLRKTKLQVRGKPL